MTFISYLTVNRQIVTHPYVLGDEYTFTEDHLIIGFFHEGKKYNSPAFFPVEQLLTHDLVGFMSIVQPQQFQQQQRIIKLEESGIIQISPPCCDCSDTPDTSPVFENFTLNFDINIQDDNGDPDFIDPTDDAILRVYDGSTQIDSMLYISDSSAEFARFPYLVDSEQKKNAFYVFEIDGRTRADGFDYKMYIDISDLDTDSNTLDMNYDLAFE